MSEITIILQALLYGTVAIIGLAILIPLSFYLFDKRKSSNIYRHIESSILFIAFMYWAHSWSSEYDYLLAFWVIAIFGFAFLHIMLFANPVKKKSVRKKR